MPRDRDPVGEPDTAADDLLPYWDEVVADMEATAAEYRERGWTAYEVHPGDVGVFGDKEKEGRTGFDLLAPDNEFDPVAEAFDEADGFGSAEVFRADTDATTFVVAAFEDEPSETAVIVPMHYSPHEDTEFVDMIREDGEVRIHVRPLDERRILTFTSGDPDLFLPDDA
jgi:hypothetical protein